MVPRRRVLWMAALATVLPALLLVECVSYRAQRGTPQEVIAANPGVTLHVRIVGGARAVIDRPSTSGDTLHGLCREVPVGLPSGWVETATESIAGAGGGTAVKSIPVPYRARVSIPFSEIWGIETHELDGAKTAELIAGLGLTAALVAYLFASSLEEDMGPSATSSSCPVILSWDGSGWRLDSGTYAGAIMPALARSEVDNLDHLRPRPSNGEARLRVAGLTGETEHVDGLALLAVDHDRRVTVVPDGGGRLHTVGRLVAPIEARDDGGRDVLQRVSKADERCWESTLRERDPERASDLRDGLEVEFPRPAGAVTAQLVVEGANTPWAMLMMREAVALHRSGTQAWYDSVAADPARARRIGVTMAREAFIAVSVWAGGGWEPQGFVGEVGPEVLKRQVVALDLSRVKGGTVRVRLESTPNLWLVDRVALDFTPEGEVTVREFRAESARDLRGRDVRALLAAEDGSEYVIAPGDTAEVTFRVPPAPAGRARTYLARTTGWYRIDAAERGEPDRALLGRLETEPGAVARYSIVRMNQALTALAEASRPRD